MPQEQPIEQPTIALTNDTTVIMIHVQACIAALKDEDGKPATRELSLAVTKLQEAVHWINEHHRIS